MDGNRNDSSVTRRERKSIVVSYHNVYVVTYEDPNYDAVVYSDDNEECRTVVG